MFLIPTANLFAFVPNNFSESFHKGIRSHVVEKPYVLRPEVKQVEASGNKSFSKLGSLSITEDQISGVNRTISGLLLVNAVPAVLTKEAILEVIFDFMENNKNMFFVNIKDLSLVESMLYLGKDEQFVKFHVERDGLIIEDASLDFRFKKGNLVQIVDKTFAEAETLSAVGAFADPSHSALNAVGGGVVVSEKQVYRVIVNGKNDGYVLIPSKSYQVAASNGSSYKVQVDQSSGKVFDVTNNHYFYEGKVALKVYERWFNDDLVFSPGSNVDVLADGRTVRSDADGQISDLGSPSSFKVDGLSGKFVKINPMTGNPISKEGVFADSIWSLDLETAENDHNTNDTYTAQAMIYHHTDMIIKKAIEHIGMFHWFERPMTANANLSRSCNAHWDGSTINLYSGSSQCANTGLISDVIYHEWGHGLDANAGGIEDGAFSEGFGDIMSLVMTHSNLLGIGFRLPSNGPVRDLEPDKVYPQDRGEVHAEGLIIGSTFWDMYKGLKDRLGEEEAGAVISNYAFKMILTASRYTEVYDALLVIDDNDGNLVNGTPNLCVINEAFAAHGLTQEAAACKLASVETYKVIDPDQDGIIEPGETVEVKVYAKNSSSEVIEHLAGEMTLSRGEQVTVEQGSITWEPIAAGETAESKDAISIKVSEDAVCGSTFNTELKLSTDIREVVLQKEFVIGNYLGNGEVTTAEAVDLPVAVIDHETVAVPVQIAGDEWLDHTTIGSARLKFNITHTYVGDLTVHLKAPDGTRIKVFQGSGSGRNVEFDRDITALIATGVAGKGEWTLEVTDNARRDEGTLDAFSLELAPTIYECN